MGVPCTLKEKFHLCLNNEEYLTSLSSLTLLYSSLYTLWPPLCVTWWGISFVPCIINLADLITPVLPDPFYKIANSNTNKNTLITHVQNKYTEKLFTCLYTFRTTHDKHVFYMSWTYVDTHNFMFNMRIVSVCNSC